MKKVTAILTVFLFAGTAFAAENKTRPALGVGELAALFDSKPTGNVSNGADLHQKHWCSSCHGSTGVSGSRNYPSIAGQVESYTYKTLLDYRDGRRNEGDGRSAAMSASVQKLTDQEFADLAAYYAQSAAPSGTSQAPVADNIIKLVRHGDPQRLITPCASCHGVDGKAGVRPETPALAGIEASYLAHTLRMYKKDKRANDSANGMGFFAERLTSEEIDQLSSYYASLQKKP